jgi:hypothetical protein
LPQSSPGVQFGPDAFTGDRSERDQDQKAADDVQRCLVAVPGAFYIVSGREGLNPTYQSMLRRDLSGSGYCSQSASNLVVGSFAIGIALSPAAAAEHQRQIRLYGQQSVERLPSGEFRYYGTVRSAKITGEMVGTRTVRQWDPSTGDKLTCHETLDQDGNIRTIRPETGGPKLHYDFDRQGRFIGVREEGIGGTK